MPKKIPPNSNADSASSDSLSFASLVCIQDQQLMPQARKDGPELQKHNPDFEFICSNLGSVNRTPGHKFILNGHQAGGAAAAATPAHHSQLPKQIDLGDVLSQYSPNLGNTRSDVKKTNHGSSSLSYRSKRKTTNETGGKKSFSEKLSSFVKPCRDCHASDPRTVIEQKALK